MAALVYFKSGAPALPFLGCFMLEVVRADKNNES